jgi:hypothetical protein
MGKTIMKLVARVFIFCLFINTMGLNPVAQSTSKEWVVITPGVGIGGVLINKSTEGDVSAIFGDKYALITHNKYSCEMKFDALGLSFFYCLKDEQKRIFLIEAHQGVTDKGIVIGRSTANDVDKIYGEQNVNGKCDSDSCIYEISGMQLYIEADMAELKTRNAIRPEPKVVEIDVVAPDKSCNFCGSGDRESKP